MTTNDTYTLLSLLPSTSYALSYALPLFFVSLLLTFAGCFLTLDRTRSFAPTSVPPSTPRSKRVCGHLLPNKWSAVLEGGVGGLAAGYSFGVHFSTFLALTIPHTTSCGPLGSKAFTAIWILSAVICTLLAGRYRYAAIVMASVAGYGTFALSFAVIIHPGLLARVVLTAVFVPIGTVICLLPFTRYARPALRIACASAGSFGLILSIALMSRVAPWANVWERYYIHDGEGWGSSKERGMSAVFCFLLILGIVCDWFLHHRFGENPDEKWDRYLADYSSNLPNDHHRAGTFAPLASWWDRVFGQHRSFAPIVPDSALPGDVDIKAPLSFATSPRGSLSKPRKVQVQVTEASELLWNDKPKSPKSLRKKGSNRVPGTKRTRRAIKFRPLNPDEEAFSSDDDDDDALDDKPPQRKLSISMRTDSSATLTNTHSRERRQQQAVDGDVEALAPPTRSWGKRGDVPEYSDYEEDISSAAKVQPDRDQPGWTPGFIRRHSILTNPHSIGRSSSTPVPAANDSFTPLPQERMRTPPTRSATSPVPAADLAPGYPVASVPATPSLIRAVERIQAAQQDIYGPEMAMPVSPSPPPVGAPASERQQRQLAWNAFWSEVKSKSQSPPPPPS